MVEGHVADQDRGESIDLLHHAVDLAIFRTVDRDVGQRAREPRVQLVAYVRQPPPDEDERFPILAEPRPTA
jgi:hypothetical protein